MKFDLVICNPPYNLASSSTSTNYKRKSKFIGKDFLEWIPTISDMSVVICPTKGYWVGKNRYTTLKRLRKLGLYSVEATDAFEEAVTLDGIAVYFFKRGYSGEIKDDFDIQFRKVENNLGNILQYGSNKLIAGKMKEKKFPPGPDTLYITSMRNIVNGIDCSEIKDPTKGSWRVILSQINSRESFGNPVLIKPNDAITYGVVCFAVESKQQGELLIDYLNSSKVRSLAKLFRVSPINSKYNFSTIPIPEFMQ